MTVLDIPANMAAMFGANGCSCSNIDDVIASYEFLFVLVKHVTL